MALSLRPLTDCFSLIWENDPAIDFDKYKEEHADASGKTSIRINAEKLAADYYVAFDTLNFMPMLKEGEKPSLFRFEPIAASRLRELHRVERPVDGQITKIAASLAFRMALVAFDDVAIDGMPKFQRATDPRYPTLGSLVSLEWTNFMDAVAREMGHDSISSDLGWLVVVRSSPRPK
jgi:hypothetical protein